VGRVLLVRTVPMEFQAFQVAQEQPERQGHPEVAVHPVSLEFLERPELPEPVVAEAVLLLRHPEVAVVVAEVVVRWIFISLEMAQLVHQQ
jgi:hypothetical protein